MDTGYLSLFAAFSDPIAIARRRALLRVIGAVMLTTVIVIVAYYSLGIYQLWQVWPIIWPPSQAVATTAIGYGTFITEGFLLWMALIYIATWGPPQIVGAFTRPLPVFSFAQALQAAIVARDPIVAPVVDPEQAASESSDEPLASVIERLTHPGWENETNSVYLFGGLGGVSIVTCATFLLGFFTDLNLAPDPAVVALHIPLLTWLSPYRLVIGASPLGVFFGLSGCLCLALMFVYLRYNRIVRAGMTSRADVDGFQIHYPGAPSMAWSARWDEVTGFARLRYRDDKRQNYDAYLLLVGERTLIWEKQPLNRSASLVSSDEVSAANNVTETFIAAVMQYAPVPLVSVSKILRSNHRSPNSANTPMNWNLLGNAEWIARSENDFQLWREIWEKRRPGKTAPHISSPGFSALFTGFIAPSARANLLRAAKEMLPYWPSRDVVRATLRTGFLSRWYAWLTVIVASLVLTMALAALGYLNYIVKP